jgi:predicted dehydrogenase
MAAPIRFAIIGAGAIAHAHVDALKQSNRAELAAIADIDVDKARELAHRAGVRALASHEALATQSDFDAVIVCTPPATHPAICKDLLNRGFHVLCEKPLSINVGEAEEMLATAWRRRVVFTMASKFRHVEDVQRAKTIVLSGAIGDLVLVENSFTSRVDMSKRWNSDPGISGGGVLIDNGTHAVDILRFFLGSVVDVQVVEAKRIQGLQVEDTVRLFVRSEHGVIGSSDLSWSINKEAGTFLRIYGSGGTILVGWHESRYRVAASGKWTVFGKGYDKQQAFVSQIDNFCGAIAGTERLVVDPADALASVDVIAAAYGAMRRSRWTGVAPLPKSLIGMTYSAASPR